MEFFALTKLGYSDPIKAFMRDDYKEPQVPPDVLEKYKAGLTTKPFGDLVAEIDVYIGTADGYAYNSVDRLQRMRRKGCFKEVGPLDMYKAPICTSMDLGWWMNDPALKDQTWYLVTEKHPQPRSEMSRFQSYTIGLSK